MKKIVIAMAILLCAAGCENAVTFHATCSEGDVNKLVCSNGMTYLCEKINEKYYWHKIENIDKIDKEDVEDCIIIKEQECNSNTELCMDRGGFGFGIVCVDNQLSACTVKKPCVCPKDKPNCEIDEKVCPECVNNETKCENSVIYSCINGHWESVSERFECQDGLIRICENDGWLNQEPQKCVEWDGAGRRCPKNEPHRCDSSASCKVDNECGECNNNAAPKCHENHIDICENGVWHHTETPCGCEEFGGWECKEIFNDKVGYSCIGENQYEPCNKENVSCTATGECGKCFNGYKDCGGKKGNPRVCVAGTWSERKGCNQDESCQDGECKCNTGTKRCTGDNSVIVCNKDGAWVDGETCGTGQTCDNGVCRTPTGTTCSNEKNEITCIQGKPKSVCIGQDSYIIDSECYSIFSSKQTITVEFTEGNPTPGCYEYSAESFTKHNYYIKTGADNMTYGKHEIEYCPYGCAKGGCQLCPGGDCESICDNSGKELYCPESPKSSNELCVRDTIVNLSDSNCSDLLEREYDDFFDFTSEPPILDGCYSNESERYYVEDSKISRCSIGCQTDDNDINSGCSCEDENDTTHCNSKNIACLGGRWRHNPIVFTIGNDEKREFRFVCKEGYSCNINDESIGKIREFMNGTTNVLRIVINKLQLQCGGFMDSSDSLTAYMVDGKPYVRKNVYYRNQEIGDQQVEIMFCIGDCGQYDY